MADEKLLYAAGTQENSHLSRTHDIQTSQTIITHIAVYQAMIDCHDSDVMTQLSQDCSHGQLSRNGSDALTEVPKELPTVSMVNTSLKKLKRHLTGFDKVVKERTTATAITEGTWGFEHTKACFRDEIIPFIKELKDIFNNFNQYLVEELADVQKVFYQMEQAVEQHRLESESFENKMNQVLSEMGNDSWASLLLRIL
ncbi:hypothetical protein Tco_1001373 [Tanacetum coccineum]